MVTINVINSSYLSAQQSFTSIQMQKQIHDSLLAKLNLEAQVLCFQVNVFPSYSASSLREGVCKERKSKKEEGRMKEWARRRKDMWKRSRKDLNLFDFGLWMLPNYVSFFKYFCSLYSLEEIFKLKIFPYTIILSHFIDQQQIIQGQKTLGI